MSGAGKSQALRCFEDLGFYCVDNLPASLLPEFAQHLRNDPQLYGRVSLGIDARAASKLVNCASRFRERVKREPSLIAPWPAFAAPLGRAESRKRSRGPTKH